MYVIESRASNLGRASSSLSAHMLRCQSNCDSRQHHQCRHNRHLPHSHRPQHLRPHLFHGHGHIHLVMVARGTEPPYSWSNSEKNPFFVMMYILSWLFWRWWWWCLGKCHTWGNIEAPLSFSFSLVMFECVQNLLIKLILFRELKMSATFSWFCQREEFCRTRRQPT